MSELAATAGRASRPFEVTNRMVLAIAVPMTLAYLTTPFVGIVDTAVIGQLGDAGLIGAVAVGAILFDLIFTTCNFLRSGTTGLAAQAVGAGDREAERAILYRACLLALAIGFVAIALQAPLVWFFVRLMGPSETVAAGTEIYLSARMLSAPFALANYAILGWFLGLGRAGLGLLLQAGLALINIALSLWFVLGLGLGIAGAAWATVAAEAIIAVVGGLLAMRELRGRWRIDRRTLFEMEAIRLMMGMNRDIMIRSFVLIGTFAAFTSIGARSGDLVLAANAVLMNFFLFAGYFLDGFAIAAEQIGGRAIGARWRPAFDRAVRLTFLWGFALAFLLSAVMLVFGERFVALMTTAEDVRATAHVYMLWAVATPLAGVAAFQFDGIYIGATWSREMRNTMLASAAVFILVLWTAGGLWGNHGLWMALNAFLLMRGVGMMVMLPRKRAETFGG
ncbi:MAG: MATE family efflux transporter [Flavobacteriaceae bacterium]